MRSKEEAYAPRPTEANLSSWPFWMQLALTALVGLSSELTDTQVPREPPWTLGHLRGPGLGHPHPM